MKDITDAIALKETLGEELYGEVTRSVLFTEFLIDRMDELGFDVPDDVPLHLTVDYHLVLLKLLIEQAQAKNLPIPQPEHSNIELRESMI